MTSCKPTYSGTTHRSVWVMAIGSAIALWASFPPVGWAWLAWVATAGWCGLVAVDAIPTRRPYRLIYLVGLGHWLVLFQWVRLPHWSAYFGWLALTAYLAIYVPLFVGVSRQLVHRMRIPLCIACPIGWTGLEFLRGRLFTGFSMGVLAHTQFRSPAILQIADLGGACLVSALLVLVASSLVQTLLPWMAPATHDPDDDQSGRKRFQIQQAWPLAFAAACVLAAFQYSHQSLPTVAPSAHDATDARSVSVALIQGNVDTTFDGSMDPTKTLMDYRRLTRSAIANNPDVALIVWPESMQTVPWLTITDPVELDPAFPGSPTEFRSELETRRLIGQHQASWFARNFQIPAIVGTSHFDLGDHPIRQHNSGLWLDRYGKAAGRYDKMHPVMFGEYVPLGNLFPFLYRLTPMHSGLAPGTRPLAVQIPMDHRKDPDRSGTAIDQPDRLIFSPCICYENTVPHLLRRQVRALTAKGQNPDALVTLTNDGWFWGSSQLDFHLASAIFRAVELRRPMLVAANTGFSAWIDQWGRVQGQGPRHAEGSVIARVEPRNRDASLYEKMGDRIWGLPCAILCLLASLVGRIGRFRR